MPSVIANGDKFGAGGDTFDVLAFNENGQLTSMSSGLDADSLYLNYGMDNGQQHDLFQTATNAKYSAGPMSADSTSYSPMTPMMASALSQSSQSSPSSSVAMMGSPMTAPLTEAQKAALSAVEEAKAAQIQQQLMAQGIDTTGMTVQELRQLAAQMQNISSATATEIRRQMHIQSEQKRREQIKGGFDGLKAELPGSQHKRISKSLLLIRAIEYFRQLKAERQIIAQELDRLRMENHRLKTMLSSAHS